jgi:CheY-like chemotaxis protein
MLESWEPRRRALVIEGNARRRRDTCLALESRGIEAITAPDGNLGLHVVADELFDLDLLVVDLDAPERDGWEILHVIRERGNEQDLRVLVTTDQPAAVRGNLHAMGADAVVDHRRGALAIADESAALLAAGPRVWGESQPPRERLRATG